MSTKNSVLLRSRDRISGNSSDFELKVQYALDGEHAVKNIQIANSCYSVRAGVNDKIYFYENSTAKSATITAGQYTSSTIASAIKTVMDTASGGHNTYTVTFASSTQKITFSASNAFYFQFASNTSASARRIMGFDAEDTASGSSVTSTNAIDLTGTHAVYIAIPEAEHNLRKSGGPLRSSLYVPLNVDVNSFQNLAQSGDFQQILTFDRETALSVKLYDDDGNDLSLNGVEWSMLLQKR